MTAGGATVRRVEVPGPGGSVLPCLLAEPGGPPPSSGGPGLLLVHDIVGLSEDAERIAGRLADSGYTVLVPDHLGPGMLVPCVVRAVASLRRGSGEGFDRLAAGWDHLGTLPGVDPARRAVVGFCLGGGFALLWAARSDARAVAAFYGDVPTDAEALSGIPPCVAGYGGRDLVFARQGRRLRRHLESLGVEHDLKEYPHAGHAYMNRHDNLLMRLSAIGPMRSRYDEDAAEDSWTRMLGFLETHLGPG